MWGQLSTTCNISTEVAQCGTPSCSRPQPATDNGVRVGRCNWLVTPSTLMGSASWVPRAQYKSVKLSHSQDLILQPCNLQHVRQSSCLCSHIGYYTCTPSCTPISPCTQTHTHTHLPHMSIYHTLHISIFHLASYLARWPDNKKIINLCMLSGVVWVLCVCVLLLWLDGGQREVCRLFTMLYFVPILENRKLCHLSMCSGVPGVGCECNIVRYCLGFTWF